MNSASVRTRDFLQSRSGKLLLGGTALVLSAAFGPGVAQAAQLVAHRAVYDLSLAQTHGNNAPIDASGRIAFDFSGSACEGWVTNFRQLTELQPAEGNQRVSDLRSSTYENGGSKSFRFTEQTSVNGQLVENIDGAADKGAAGMLKIALTRPSQAKVDVDADVVFPTEQIERILAAAHEGKKILSLKVFDGSDTGQKVYNTLTVIGHQMTTPPSDKAARTADALEKTPRWPVTVSYFDMKKADLSPDYTLSFDLYDNGVSGNLRLNYGDFTLKGELTHFQLLPQKPCSR